MLGLQIFIKQNIETLVTSLSCHRNYRVTNFRSYHYLLKRSLEITKYRPFIRHQSNKTGQQRKIRIALSIAGVSGVAIYSYYHLKNRQSNDNSSKVSDDDVEIDTPFVYENLNEDLALLSNFGRIPYLLIGAGSASFTAFRAIRINDPKAKVLMIGEEPYFPYMRPPLSKEMWYSDKPDMAQTLSYQWNGKERTLFYEPPDYYFTVKELLENKNGGVSVMRGTKVVKIDPMSQIVYLENGGEISYEKCLIATGSKPKCLSVFEKVEESIKKHITVFRTADDFKTLDRISRKIKSIVVVGGGFLGSELVYGLAKRGTNTGLKVIQLFPECGNMAKILPEYLSKWTSKFLQGEGIKIIPEVTVKFVSHEGSKIVLHLSNNEVIVTDHVVVAVGAEPNTEIAKDSGLEIDKIHGGFIVNAELEARKNLWVAGDVSCFYDAKFGRRRVEHHDHAFVSGRLAGENMTGSGKPYLHQSIFWSDLGPEIGYEAIGIVDSTLPTVGIFAKATETDTLESIDANGQSIQSNSEQKIVNKSVLQEKHIKNTLKPNDSYRKGVIFYFKDDVIVGIVLWNVFLKISVARKIINESFKSEDVTEVAKLFELHSEE